VNPTDATFRAGGRASQLADRTPPYDPGVDVSGVIDELGPDTDVRLAVGDDRNGGSSEVDAVDQSRHTAGHQATDAVGHAVAPGDDPVGAQGAHEIVIVG